MPPKKTKSAKDKEKDKEDQEKANALYMYQGRSIKDKSDDRFESLLADCSDGTEHGRNLGVKWQKAHQAHAELRMTLVKKGAWNPEMARMGAPQVRRPPSRSAEVVAAAPRAGSRCCSVAAAAAAFFPGDWWRALTSEPLAALIVDAMAGAICDALLDACVLTLEEEESAQLAIAGPGAASGSAALSAAASAPNLARPHERRLLSMTLPAGLLASSNQLPSQLSHHAAAAEGDADRRHHAADDFGSLSRMSRSQLSHHDADRPHYAADDFVTLSMRSRSKLSHHDADRPHDAADDVGNLPMMSRSSSDSWTAGRSHACKPLEPYGGGEEDSWTAGRYLKRCEHAAAIQRPRRSNPLPPASLDQRKFIWPMAATNFPKEYDVATRKQLVKKGRGSDQAAQQAHGLPKDEHWLLDIGNDGKTKFPYSLALHKAFLESQPDPVLKEKAYKIAPLRMTGTW